MARVNRRSDLLTAVGVLLIVGVLLVALVSSDQNRREALAAKAQATAQVESLQRQQDCALGLHAKSDEALLSFLVALSSGEGAETARVDAQLATGRWVEARQRCGG